MKYLDLNGLDYFWGKIKRYIELDSVHRVEMGAPNGVATLDSAGLVPASQLPSYVDDVLEFTSVSQFPQTGEKDKIYVDLSSNLIYRWSGTQYIEISKSLALGETSTTAYAGDKGKANRQAIESLPDTILTRLSQPAYSADQIQFTAYDVAKSGLNYGVEDGIIYTLAAASQRSAGVMTSTDKTQHDSLWTYAMQIYTLNHPDTTVSAVSTSEQGMQITLNPRTQLVNGKVTENTFKINIPLATSVTNGVMSAQDKSRLDSAWGNSLSDVDINKNGSTISFGSISTGMSTTISPQYTYVDGATSSEDLVINIPLVSTTANGIMSSGDKGEHDSLWSNAISAFQLNQASNDITAQDVDDEGVRISITSKTTKVNNQSSTYTTQITVPLATTSSNGVMSAQDKDRCDQLWDERSDAMSNFVLDESSTVIASDADANGVQITLNTKKEYVDGGSQSTNYTLRVPLATTTTNGVMSAEDKTRLNSLASELDWNNLINKPTWLEDDICNWGDIQGKPSTYTPSAHTHIISQITDFPDTWAWDKITGKPSAFTPSSHTHPLSQISDLNSSWDNLLNTTPSAYITRWPSISEVTSKQNLVVKLNGGTTEGTNQFTYNGTTAKSVNITPSSIGAAASSHTHTKSQITDFPTFATINGSRIDQGGDIETTVVSFSRNLSSGTKIGTITIDGSATEIFAPLPEEAVTYSQATSSTLGLVKIGYSSDTTNHGVLLNSNGQMYITIQSISNSTIDDICV